MQYEKRPASAFNAGFNGCLGVGCAIVFVIGLFCFGVVGSCVQALDSLPSEAPGSQGQPTQGVPASPP